MCEDVINKHTVIIRKGPLEELKPTAHGRFSPLKDEDFCFVSAHGRFLLLKEEDFRL